MRQNPFLPFLLTISTSSVHIFLLQSLILILNLGGVPADAIFIKRFPVYKRFTSTTFLYALTRALMYFVTSFGVVYLTEWFGYAGTLFITIPCCVGFLAGVYYFEKIDKEKLDKPLSQSTNQITQSGSVSIGAPTYRL